jgi:hypothetical protein
VTGRGLCHCDSTRRGVPLSWTSPRTRRLAGEMALVVLGFISFVSSLFRKAAVKATAACAVRRRRSLDCSAKAGPRQFSRLLLWSDNTELRKPRRWRKQTVPTNRLNHGSGMLPVLFGARKMRRNSRTTSSPSLSQSASATFSMTS